MVFFVGYELAGARKRHAGLFGLSHVGQHDAVPARAVPRGILNIKDEVGESFIEDPRLDLEGDFLCENLVAQFP